MDRWTDGNDAWYCNMKQRSSALQLQIWGTSVFDFSKRITHHSKIWALPQKRLNEGEKRASIISNYLLRMLTNFNFIYPTDELSSLHVVVGYGVIELNIFILLENLTWRARMNFFLSTHVASTKNKFLVTKKYRAT